METDIQVLSGSSIDVQCEDVLEALADEARDYMHLVVDGDIKLNQVPPRLLRDDVWMQDVFSAMCRKKLGLNMSLNQFLKWRSISQLETLPNFDNN